MCHVLCSFAAAFTRGFWYLSFAGVQEYPCPSRIATSESKYEARVDEKRNTPITVSTRLARNHELFFSSSLTKIAKRETNKALPLALMRCLRKPFFAAVLPRPFLIVFRYSQPTLIKESIRYVTANSTRTETNHGFWLVMSAVTIYIGLAVWSPYGFLLSGADLSLRYQQLCTTTALTGWSLWLEAL